MTRTIRHFLLVALATLYWLPVHADTASRVRALLPSVTPYTGLDRAQQKVADQQAAATLALTRSQNDLARAQEWETVQRVANMPFMNEIAARNAGIAQRSMLASEKAARAAYDPKANTGRSAAANEKTALMAAGTFELQNGLIPLQMEQIQRQIANGYTPNVGDCINNPNCAAPGYNEGELWTVIRGKQARAESGGNPLSAQEQAFIKAGNIKLGVEAVKGATNVIGLAGITATAGAKAAGKIVEKIPKPSGLPPIRP